MKTSWEKWTRGKGKLFCVMLISLAMACSDDEEGSNNGATTDQTTTTDNTTTDETTTDQTTTDETTSDPENTAPVGSLIDDQDFPQGYVASVNLNDFFSDADNDALTFTATSSNTDVAGVTVDANTLSITNASIGTSNITITASDGNEGSASVSFNNMVSACTGDDALNDTRTTCDMTASMTSYSVSIANDTRTITTDGRPNHIWGNQIPMLVQNLDATSESWGIDLTPSLAASSTSVVKDNGSPNYAFGIALNGVAMDPAPGTPFIFENTETAEYNWDWVFEPNNNMTAVGLDCATAHVQPGGTYHYHGDMIEYAESLHTGISNSTVPVDISDIHIGWAADGFPVLYRYGPDENNGFELLNSSYQLKQGFRGGDGISEPCGEYNGKYTQDYEYLAGLGDLDECNGLARNVTIDNETFSYFYVITQGFPVMSRCLSGTPSEDFSKSTGMQ